jgi:hypothetical protein
MLLVALLTSGCGEPISGDASAIPPANPSVSLPFRQLFLERTNERNDGTSFEPCIVYRSDELLALGIDPTTIEDAAISRGPNFRGCHWRMPASYTSQIVVGRGSLPHYVRSHAEVEWRPQIQAHGRTIAYGSQGPDQCMAAFKSEAAIVVTSVSWWFAGKWPGTACEWVVKFASLAASKAP